VTDLGAPVGLRTARAPLPQETVMADKSKNSREVRKPKQDQNKKTKGQTPPTGGSSALTAVRGSAKPKG
jgi:hypothetical protein